MQLTHRAILISQGGLCQKLVEAPMIRGDLIEIKPSTQDRVSVHNLTQEIELARSATLDQAIGVKQQNSVNLKIKCREARASSCITLDGD